MQRRSADDSWGETGPVGALSVEWRKAPRAPVVAHVAPLAKLREGPVDCDGAIVRADQYPQALAMGDAEWRDGSL